MMYEKYDAFQPGAYGGGGEIRILGNYSYVRRDLTRRPRTRVGPRPSRLARAILKP